MNLLIALKKIMILTLRKNDSDACQYFKNIIPDKPVLRVTLKPENKELRSYS